MSDDAATPAERLRILRRVRQIREFTDEPVGAAELDAIADAARWSGSGGNEQAWRFIVIRDQTTLRRLAEAGFPQTRALRTAAAAIAIVLPDEPAKQVSRAFDEGRAAERILIAATALGLGAGISWIVPGVRAAVAEALGLPEGRFVRTILSIGHPTEAAKLPKSAPGAARLPRSEVVFAERWPAG